MSTVHLIQKASKGDKIKYITMVLEGNQIHKTWGLIGGKAQTKTSDHKEKNVGKSNYRSAAQSAADEMQRTIDKKIKEGYVKTPSLDDVSMLGDDSITIDLADIPPSLCCSKPTQTITDDDVDKLLQQDAIVTVKYNGLCHFIRILPGREVSIFTRRWDDHTSKYPNIVKQIQEDENLPENSLIIAEFCIDPLVEMPHMLAFKAMSKVSKTETIKGKCKPDQSETLALQKKYPVRVAVFGLLFWKQENTADIQYRYQWKAICNHFKPLSAKQILFRPQLVKASTAAHLRSLAERNKQLLEGFVIWSGDQGMELTLNGKPKRRAAWKFKVRGDMDVIAYEGQEGTIPGQFGSIKIGRYSEEEQFIPMGTVGGLTEEQMKPDFWEFPCVIEVTFDNVFPDTGMLQFGNFSKIHEDKSTSEVDYFTLP